MALNSNPIVQVTFNSLDQMFCTLFLQNKVSGSKFQIINSTFNNGTGNIFAFTIDPTKTPINGTSLDDLSGCSLGWVVKCFDLDHNAKITFSFNINIIDSGSNIMSINVTELSPEVTIASSGSTAVFTGTFTIS
jgi:hypothetical protein